MQLHTKYNVKESNGRERKRMKRILNNNQILDEKRKGIQVNPLKIPARYKLMSLRSHRDYRTFYTNSPPNILPIQQISNRYDRIITRSFYCNTANVV